MAKLLGVSKTMAGPGVAAIIQCDCGLEHHITIMVGQIGFNVGLRGKNERVTDIKRTDEMSYNKFSIPGPKA